MTNEIIASRLKELRGNRTLKEVSDGTGITISTLSNYEQAIRRPRDESKIALALYYGKSVDEIFFN